MARRRTARPADSPRFAYDVAHAAAWDAANNQMHAAGRTAWSAEDYDYAVQVFDRLVDAKQPVRATYALEKERGKRG
jgi:hypothetical protein